MYAMMRVGSFIQRNEEKKNICVFALLRPQIYKVSFFVFVILFTLDLHENEDIHHHHS